MREKLEQATPAQRVASRYIEASIWDTIKEKAKGVLPSPVELNSEFAEAIKGRRFKNPDTGNEVLFKSLPQEEQDKLRVEFAQSLAKKKEKEKEDKEKADKELREAEFESWDMDRQWKFQEKQRRREEYKEERKRNKSKVTLESQTNDREKRRNSLSNEGRREKMEKERERAIKKRMAEPK